MAYIEVEINTEQVESALDDAIIAYLHESAGELVSQTVRNSRVDTGQTAGSYNYKVDESAKEATVGSPLENAVWEEFGTGEYALLGNGRRGGWIYQDADGKYHRTHGKTPNRPMERAFESTKNAIISRCGEVIREAMNNDE